MIINVIERGGERTAVSVALKYRPGILAISKEPDINENGKGKNSEYKRS